MVDFVDGLKLDNGIGIRELQRLRWWKATAQGQTPNSVES